MKSFFEKLSIFLCFALLFCSLPVVHVEASSVTDQSKPIFGLTAVDVVEKYNQLSDQQKDQVLRSLGNTSIFANSLFGNIFNSTFGALDDAIEKIGDLFFQANGVIYKLGSSALSWVSRLIDKVFNNDLNDLNISQPVVNDLYLNTRNLTYIDSPLFVEPNHASYLSDLAYNNLFPLPNAHEFVYVLPANIVNYNGYSRVFSVPSLVSGNVYFGVFVDLDTSRLYLGRAVTTVNGLNQIVVSSIDDEYIQSNMLVLSSTGNKVYNWNGDNRVTTYPISFGFNFFGVDYTSILRSFLNTYCVYCSQYYIINDSILTVVPLSAEPIDYCVTNNTYYNYIYNIPDQTPLNVTNIVSNTSIDYSPADNIAYYLPEQYNIEQNFSVVNNYYISSGSAITSQGSIDVTLVSPSVIDVRITNPEDISSEVINENNNDIINNYDFDFGDLNITNSVGIGINYAKDNLADVVTTSSINAVAGFGTSGLPAKWRYAIFGFFALGIIALVITRRGIAH